MNNLPAKMASFRPYAVALIFAAGILMYVLVILYAVDYPRADDYTVHLEFLNRYENSSHLQKKLENLFKYHSQHLQILNRLVALLYYKIFGSLNYKVLIIFGNLSLFGICYLLYHIFTVEKNLKPLLFLPVAFFFFQPQYCVTTLWATTVWQFFFVNFFTILALIFSQDSKPIRWFWVIIFSLFAALTQGNGAMVPAVISVVLLLQKRCKASSCCVITGVAFLLIFQYKNLSALFSPGSMAGNLWIKLDYTFSLLGAALAFSHHLPAFLFGMLILLYFIFLSLIKYYRSNPIIYGYFLFLIISVGTNAQFRAPVGIISYTIPRYCFLSVLLLIMIYISLIEILNNHRFFRFVFVSSLILSIVFYLVSYRLHFDDYRRNHLLLKDYMLCWQLGADVVPDANQRRCLKIQKIALHNGILKPPDVNISDYYSERITLDIPLQKREVMYNIDNFVETPECVLVKGWAFIDEDSEGSEIFLVLRSAYVQYVFTLLRRDRPDVTAYYKEVFTERNLDQSGFIGIIEKSKLIEDDYQLGIVVVKDETAAIKMLPQAVSVS